MATPNTFLTRIFRRRALGLLGLLGYIPFLATFFFGIDNIYFYTSRETPYGGYHAKEINEKFNTPLLNEHARTSTVNGMTSYNDEDVVLKTLYIRNNSNYRLAAPGDVELVLCPMPRYFVIRSYDFALSRDDSAGPDCGKLQNVQPIPPAQTSSVYYFSPEFPKIWAAYKSNSYLSSGDLLLELQLTVRGVMFFGAFVIVVSGSSFIVEFVMDAVRSRFHLHGWVQRVLGLIVFFSAVAALGTIALSPILMLSDYELAGDYDKGPALLNSAMQLVEIPPSQAAAIDDLLRSGKAAEALELEKAIAAKTEKAEAESIGKPGIATASALGDVSWLALLARRYDDALTAADRALEIAPQEIWIETNRDHAILLLGRVAEARALYLKRKGTIVLGRRWEDVIREDFDRMRKASIDDPNFAEIEASLSNH